MTLDGGWGLIIATMIGVLMTWLGGLVVKHFSNNEEAADGAHSAVKELDKRVTALQIDQLEYKAYMAEHYAKIAQLERMESTIFAVMQRIEQKVDRLQENGARND